MKNTVLLLPLIALFACNGNKDEQMKYKEIGSLERLDPSLDSIALSTAKAEIIAEGLDWSEGPLWLEKQNMLLFSDVPQNTIYKWTPGKGKEVYLNPSGYTDSTKRGGEMGSNGLTLDNNGNLVLCQHGNRQVARMDAPIDQPAPKYIPLASNFQGKKFNSPNDVTYNSAGELFFTDPPYGLEEGSTVAKKEIPFQGVYKVKQNGEVVLLVDSLTRPNGIAFMPGGSQMIVANSDPDLPNWYVYDINGDSATNGRIFYSLTSYDKNLKGLPDGFKIDKNGNVIATGPGGIYFFNRDGKLLGKFRVDEPTSNIALSADEKTIYITNDMYILRLKMR